MCASFETWVFFFLFAYMWSQATDINDIASQTLKWIFCFQYMLSFFENRFHWLHMWHAYSWWKTKREEILVHRKRCRYTICVCGASRVLAHPWTVSMEIRLQKKITKYMFCCSFVNEWMYAGVSVWRETFTDLVLVIKIKYSHTRTPTKIEKQTKKICSTNSWLTRLLSSQFE